MKVLVIEDTSFMAKTFAQLLQEQGHEVTIVIGFKRLSPMVIAIDTKKQPLPIDLAEFDLALCDGELYGEIGGPAAVEVLARAGVACFGTSTNPDMNDSMLTKGAILAFLKTAVVCGLLDGTFVAAQLKQDAPRLLADKQAVQARLCSDKGLMARGDALLSQFFLSDEE
ncbi:MAG: hypothetical protein K2W82_16540 [Candidatus Obscuribacterales bacterium]|nr:hypothetical protein [Candidatus Obscuribacterales bacterium]